jgi:hypothetical protein
MRLWRTGSRQLSCHNRTDPLHNGRVFHEHAYHGMFCFRAAHSPSEPGNYVSAAISPPMNPGGSGRYISNRSTPPYARPKDTRRERLTNWPSQSGDLRCGSAPTAGMVQTVRLANALGLRLAVAAGQRDVDDARAHGPARLSAFPGIGKPLQIALGA